jgi:hypothetical protein
MQRMAQMHTQMAKNIFELSLDYSEESLRKIDEAITTFHPDGNALETTLLPYGAYVGETVRRLLGGEWEQDAEGVTWLSGVGGVEMKISPFAWVKKRFANGMEDSIVFKYDVVKQQLAQAGGAPAPAAALAELPAENEPAQELPTPGEGQPTDDARGIIMRAPLMAFIMLGAANGGVNKKLANAWLKVLPNATLNVTPLLREALAVSVADLEQNVARVYEGNFAAELQMISPLLEQFYPAEAQAFKEQLVAVMMAVAKSSHGFMGIGQKIGSKDMDAIGSLIVALGLSSENE